jgi:hypothetical protein
MQTPKKMKVGPACIPSSVVSIEGQHFSERLQRALRNAGYAPDSPTQLTRAFNAHFEETPITVHEAREWLIGAAMPNGHKLRALMQWLPILAE